MYRESGLPDDEPLAGPHLAALNWGVAKPDVILREFRILGGTDPAPRDDEFGAVPFDSGVEPRDHPILGNHPVALAWVAADPDRLVLRQCVPPRVAAGSGHMTACPSGDGLYLGQSFQIGHAGARSNN